jgi:hypothetical protein
MRFQATLQLHGKTATGFVVPPTVVDGLAGGKKPPVTVTIGSHSYRSSIASRGGEFLLGVSAENRAAAGIAAGDLVDVDVELDTEPRVVTVPDDLAVALATAPATAEAFARLAYSHQLAHVLAVGGARTPETRERRVAAVVRALSPGE